MKVAMISDCYLPRLGGIEVQVHDLAGALRAAGHDAQVFTATASPGVRRGPDRVDDVPVHRLAPPAPVSLPVNPMATGRLRAMLRGGRFDVVHAHLGLVSPFAMDGVRVALRLGLPTLVTWHSVQSGVPRLVHAIGYVRRWAARGVGLSAVSTVVAGQLTALAGGTSPVAVLPNGIDPDRWTVAEPAVHAPLVVVSAMRLASRKRPGRLVRIVHRVRLERPDAAVRLKILGDGPARGRVRRLAGRLGRDGWCELGGRVERPRLRETYAAADVYVAPARLEAFGIAALEARTAGLPVVAPRGSGVADFIRDGVHGLLAGDDRGMVDCLIRLIDDPGLRERIACHNRCVPPEQTWGAVVRATVGEYQRIAE